MDQNTINLSGLLEYQRTGCCLICCSTYPKNNLSTNNGKTEHNKLTKATEKIFKYLLIPKEKFVKVKMKESLLSFCPNCMGIVEEIIELQKKAEILELQIKCKVETIGRVAIETPANLTLVGDNITNRREVTEVWKIFKAHVTLNFLKGLLPNPSVKVKLLETAGIMESKSKIKQGQVKSFSKKFYYNCSSLNTKIGEEDSISVAESYCTRLIIPKQFSKQDKPFNSIFDGMVMQDGNTRKAKTEEDLVPQSHNVDYDSNDDLFEEITLPLNAVRSKDVDEDKSNKPIKSGIFDNVQIKFPQPEAEPCDSEKSRSLILSTGETCLVIKDVKSLNSTTNSNENDTNYRGNTGESEIWMRDTDKTEETYRTLNHNEAIIITEENNDEVIICDGQNKTNGRMEEIEATKDTVAQFSNEEYDSNDDLFDEISIPVNAARRREIKKRKINDKKKALDLFHKAITNRRPGSETITIPHVNDINKEQVTIKNKVCVGNRDAEEYNSNYDDNSFIITDSTEINYTDQCHTLLSVSERKQNESEIGMGNKRCRPASPPNTRCTGDNNNPVTNTSSKNEFNNTTDCITEFHNSATDRNIECPQLKRRKPNNLLRKLTNINKVVHTSKPGSSNTKDKETLINRKKAENLIKGREYLKCTKCDYSVKNVPTHSYKKIRNKLASHYSSSHNPIKRTDVSKTISGKYFYKCTKCTFSIALSSNHYQNRQRCHQKLSLHYITFHDAFADEFDSKKNKIKQQAQEQLAQNEKGNASSPITVSDELEYFSCPITNCHFQALIRREECQKQQLQNATKARLEIIEHYRTSLKHNAERKSTLSHIRDTTLVSESTNVKFYKCTKCEFKSIVGKYKKDGTSSHAKDPKARARKDLLVHYLLEHVFPWETFPGLYKYGCYEEKSEDGNVLKCRYSDCDFFIKIQYDLEGRNQEEYQLTAFKSFSSHALEQHHFNSIGLIGENLEYFPNEGQNSLLLSKKEKDRNRFQSVDLDRNFDHQVITTRSKRRKLDNLPTPHPKINHFGEPIRDPDDIKKQLEGLIEGQDYFKCTKCDYFVKTTPKSSSIDKWKLRRKVAYHYGRHHNPVKPSDSFKTLDGSDCYRCTKCNFQVTIKSGIKCARKDSRLKLTSHFMEFHDAFENLLTETPGHSLTSLTEGIHYFACPVANCTFVALIKKEETQKQQVTNVAEARLKLIEHYRSSLAHFNERKNTLSEITSISKDRGVNFYKCAKCDFKSFLPKRKNFVCRNPGKMALKALIFHFLLEHVFPWDCFPSLYRHGCHEEKIEDGNVLKCIYTECDYAIKIQGDLEGTSDEESQAAAYQLFIENHALNHNYNLMGFDYSERFPYNPTEETGVQNIPSEDIQMNSNGEESTRITYNFFDAKVNTYVRDMVYEEVTVESKLWFEGYEEPEEMN